MKTLISIAFAVLFLVSNLNAVEALTCSEKADKCYVYCDTKFIDDGYKRRGCKQKCVSTKVDCQSKSGSKKLKNLTDKGAKKVEDFLSGLKD